jgi:hypothetical protein
LANRTGAAVYLTGAHDLVVQDLKIDLLGVVYETHFDGLARIPEKPGQGLRPLPGTFVHR